MEFLTKILIQDIRKYQSNLSLNFSSLHIFVLETITETNILLCFSSERHPLVSSLSLRRQADDSSVTDVF